MMRAVAISLKIPDNTAFTAAVALRRLGIGVDRVERSEVRFFEDGGNVPLLLERIAADETIFNPNKHRATVLDETVPRPGEVWIEPLEGGVVVAWRLFGAADAIFDREALHAAAEGLLCNSAIERAIY